MSAGVKQATINAVEGWAEKQWQIRSVHFFGSRVRGNDCSNSDLDIAIELVFDDADGALGQWMFLLPIWTGDLSVLLDHVLDLQWLHEQATPTIGSAVKEAGAPVFVRRLTN